LIFGVVIDGVVVAIGANGTLLVAFLGLAEGAPLVDAGLIFFLVVVAVGGAAVVLRVGDFGRSGNASNAERNTLDEDEVAVEGVAV